MVNVYWIIHEPYTFVTYEEIRKCWMNFQYRQYNYR